jgi:ABC-type multidrug transport system fused ATPase/permease subunit
MSLRALRQQMSIIPQVCFKNENLWPFSKNFIYKKKKFGFLYNATLKDNIDPLELFSEEEVNKKIDDTGLRIREGSMAEDGLCDFEVEDSGANLSNGEKQIINFLRIVLRDQSIVCLDEATSNMDPKTDCQLHEKLFEFC